MMNAYNRRAQLAEAEKRSLIRPFTRAGLPRERFLEADTIFVPIFQADANHWMLLILRPLTRTITFFDSLANPELYNQEL